MVINLVYLHSVTTINIRPGGNWYRCRARDWVVVNTNQSLSPRASLRCRVINAALLLGVDAAAASRAEINVRMFCGHDSVRGRVAKFFKAILSERIYRSQYNTIRRPQLEKQ